MANLSDDPEFPAEARKLNRLLNGPTPGELTDLLQQVMNDAMQVADPEGGPIIIGQINVLTVTHYWITQYAENPDATIHLIEAVREIQNAIEAGMRGERL
jgi:hypothetical protein